MRELAILIEKYVADGVPNAVCSARQAINIKYGKGWRENYIRTIGVRDISIYDDHMYGEHWMD